MATIQNRNYFFMIVPGTDRFRSGDEPTELVMRDFLESVAFKKEVSDTATQSNQGLVETADQNEFNNGIDNDLTTGFALYVRPSMIKQALDNIVGYIDGLVLVINNTLTSLQNQINTTNTNVNNLTNTVNNLSTTLGESMPVGSILEWPNSMPPNSKWLMAEGQSVAVATYPDLFALIGYSQGGAGANFNLPNFKQKFVAGYDGSVVGYNQIGFGGGQDNVTLALNNIPPHRHTVNTTLTDNGQIQVVNAGSHVHGSIGSDIVDTDAGEITVPNLNVGGGSFSDHLAAGDHTHTVTGQTGDGTTDGLATQAFDNRPRYISIPRIIKVLA